ncbi:MAG: 23S rRNA (uracil(1939)-C(5))-methyltransferase RlmD, partial [Clostridiales bacterium]|nr:23S rRNA (uracil(1939)-C(5))-methyltransferase RlmD [Clostridiales bacterium]
DGIGYEGEGIAHINGYTVFIRYALPGEKVRAVIILAKPTFAVGKLTAVLRASPDRAEPFCPVYCKCGGCALQHMTYEAQLRSKQNSVRETFFKVAHMRVDPAPCVASPAQRAYRNKMSLPVRGNPAAVGFFASASHRLVPVEHCPIQFAGNGALIAAFTDFLHAENISGYNETEHTGVVRHLVARTTGDRITVTVVVNGAFKKRIAPFDAALKRLYGEKYAFYINTNTSAGNRILGEKSELAGGDPAPVGTDGLRIAVHPHAFMQVNDGVRRLLYAAAANEVRAANVVDAYSGAGVLSAILAKNAASVTAVEIEPAAVRSANDLMAQNGIQNVRCLCGDCATLLPQVLRGCDGENTAVVLDPPRAGCARTVLDAVTKAAAQKIVYISCNPATLARDAALLTSGGYTIASLTPFDMFPQTAGVETLCVFTRA